MRGPLSLRRELTTFASGPFELVASVDLPDGAGPDARVPGVLFCHGFTGSRMEARRLYARLAQKLAARGIGVFRFDHRGCGDSDGDFLDFTPAGLLEDLDCALAAFMRQEWLDRAGMGIVGYSLGGVSASYVLGREPSFRAGVMWAPVSRPGIIRERLAKLPGFDLHGKQGHFDYYGWRVSREYIDGIGEAAKPVEWIRGYAGPVLFIHGAADELVRPEQTERFLAARANPGDRRLLIDGGDHSFTTADNMDLVLRESEEWLASHLPG